MKIARIGIISHHIETIDLASELSFETGHELIVKLGIPYTNLIEKAQILKNEYKVDAIIAQGSIYERIYNKIDIPVFRMDLSNFELAQAFYQASKLSDKVLFIEFQRITKTYDFELVKNTFNYKVDNICLHGPEELDKAHKIIRKNKYEVVVCTGKSILDQFSGVHKIWLDTKKADLTETLSLVLQTIYAEKRRKEKISWLRSIVNNLEVGIITIDPSGIIETFNTHAAEITGMEAQDGIGRNIKNLLSNQEINCIYGDGENISNAMATLDIGKIIINRISIKLGTDQYGLLIKFQKATKIQELEQKIRKELTSRGFVAKSKFTDIIGSSSVMRELKSTAQKYASTSSNIVILGESGTGKELFAQSIHNSSNYKNGPFVAVNCAALTESLLESELFGYEEGAFTGAKKGGKQGLFELAHGGTIFLDEIGDMPASLQSRLLRVIQEREVIRLGGSRIIPVNNRVICATNVDLAEKVKKGLFRKDLYYRINILQLRIPPLREHPEDISDITLAIFRKKCKAMKRNISMSPDLLTMLKEYDWPGNTREIEAFIERLLSTIEESKIEYDDIVRCFNNIRDIKKTDFLHPHLSQTPASLKDGKLTVNLGTMSEIETEVIQQVLHYVNGDKAAVKKILGISPTTIWRKTKKQIIAEQI